MPGSSFLPPGFIALRDEVEGGMRTLYHTPLFADVYAQKYVVVLPRPNRGPDERLQFANLDQLPDAAQQLICRGPCPVGRSDFWAALADLDGDGIANWQFSAHLNAPNQRNQGEYYISVRYFEDGRWHDAHIDDFSAVADHRDGLPGIYLRDEFTGHADYATRTFYSTRNGPRQRIPFN